MTSTDTEKQELPDPADMTPQAIREEIADISRRRHVRGGPCCRLDVGDPRTSGERGDLLALRAIDRYLGRRGW